MPIMSVIVPVYDVEQYLPNCLDALCGQTFHDIEIICVDDGSTDGSAEIIRAYQKNDKRITLIQQENQGVSAARNAGMAAARGTYVMFADPDDYFDEDACQIMHTIITSKHADVAIAGAKVIVSCDEANNEKLFVHKQNKVTVQLLNPRNAYYAKFDPALLFKEASHPFPWRMIILREFMNENNLRFRVDLHFGEDEAFAFDVLPRAQGVALSDQKPFNYRAGRPRSLMDLRLSEIGLQVSDHLDVIDAVFDSWHKQGLATNNARNLATWALRYVVFDIRHLQEPQRTCAFERLGRALVRTFPVTGGIVGKGKLQKVTRSLVQVATTGDASGLGTSFYMDAYLCVFGVLRTTQFVAQKAVTMAKHTKAASY